MYSGNWAMTPAGVPERIRSSRGSSDFLIFDTS
jgi:hypothetical protein